MPKDFDEVILTKDEQELALFNARCEKYWKKKQDDTQNAIAKAKEDAKIPFTCEQLKEFVLKSNPWFKLDEQAKEVFELLALYFTNDPEFERRGYSLTKGICLSGPVGVGKTELLNIFRINKRQCFHMVTVFDIETMLQEKGIESIQAFYDHVPGWGGSPKRFYHLQVGWAFDDVGRESVVFDFGNKTDALSKIFQTRYFKKIPFSALHITTNKTPAELEKRYDEAVRSRLREMFNYIVYKGSDRRK